MCIKLNFENTMVMIGLNSYNINRVLMVGRPEDYINKISLSTHLSMKFGLVINFKIPINALFCCSFARKLPIFFFFFAWFGSLHPSHQR